MCCGLRVACFLVFFSILFDAFLRGASRGEVLLVVLVLLLMVADDVNVVLVVVLEARGLVGASSSCFLWDELAVLVAGEAPSERCSSRSGP